MFPNVDASDSRCIGKIIAGDLRLVPSRLYRAAVTQPGSCAAMTVTMPIVAETFKIVTNEMAHGTDFKLLNTMHDRNVNHTQVDRNTTIDEPGNRWNIHFVQFDTLTSRVKPSSNGWLSICSWSSRIIDESQWYLMKNIVGCRISRNTRIGFKLPVTVTSEFNSLHDWCYQAMWLFSGVPECPEDDTVREKHSANALYPL
jgi:hypothetical protein